MSRGTTQIDDETEDDETDNCDDLDGGEPELAFTEGAGTQEVDDDDDDTSDGNPCGIVDLAVPVCKRPQALSVFTAHGGMIGKDAQLMRTAAADSSAGRVITHEYQ